MAQGKWLQTNFSFGELSPSLAGFVDLKDYIRGLSSVENFINLNNGGLTFRPGSYYAANTALDATAALIPFIFNTGEAYILEFTANRIRFYTNNGQLDASYTITDATWASNSITFTFNANHCFILQDTVTIAGVSPSGYNGTYTVTDRTATTITVTQATNPGTYTSGGTGTGPYQVVSTPYSNPPTSWAQSEDVLYLADGVNPPQQLERLGTVDWTLKDVVFSNGPYMPVNTSTTTINVVTGGTDSLVSSENLFASTDVGRSVLILDSGASYNGSSGEWKWTTITAFTDAKHVDCDGLWTTVGDTNTAATWSGSATTQWALGAWSDTTGYPACVAFHQQRLIYGGETGNPQMVRGSMTGLYDNFSPFDPDGSVNPDNAYSFQIASGQADPIRWIVGAKRLFVGTASAEYLLMSSGPSITPLDITVEQQTRLGTSDGMQPIRTNWRLFLFERGKKMLHDFAFAYFVGGYRVTLLNKLADHIFLPSAVKADYTYNPFARIWVARSDGQLVTGLDTYESEGGIGSPVGGAYGYTRCIMGGSYNSGDAVVESVAVIPTTTYDQVWLAVKRTVNGQTVRHVEYLADIWDGTAIADAYYVDAGLSYSGSSTNTFTGLDHLEGETVTCFLDGTTVETHTVSGGSVTTTTSASTAAIGLPYTGVFSTMQLNTGEVQGHLLYAVRAYLRLLNTQNGKILTGSDYTTAVNINESKNTLYTGYARHLLSHGSDMDQHLYVQQSSPWPMSVLNASIEFNAGMS